MNKNFKHILNPHLQTKIANACREGGYEPPVICTPQQLLETEDEPDRKQWIDAVRRFLDNAQKIKALFQRAVKSFREVLSGASVGRTRASILLHSRIPKRLVQLRFVGSPA